MQSITTRVRPILAVLGITLSLSLAACDDGEENTENSGETEAGETTLDIVGDYVDDFMGTHSVTETEWTSGDAVFAILEYDNDAQYVIAQNADGNMFNPGLFSRFDWTYDGDQLYYCQSVYDGATVEVALMGGADANDLAAGCGMFAWSMLTPE